MQSEPQLFTRNEIQKWWRNLYTEQRGCSCFQGNISWKTGLHEHFVNLLSELTGIWCRKQRGRH